MAAEFSGFDFEGFSDSQLLALELESDLLRANQQALSTEEALHLGGNDGEPEAQPPQAAAEGEPEAPTSVRRLLVCFGFVHNFHCRCETVKLPGHPVKSLVPLQWGNLLAAPVGNYRVW
jgi:hypothetical protein